MTHRKTLENGVDDGDLVLDQVATDVEHGRQSAVGIEG